MTADIVIPTAHLSQHHEFNRHGHSSTFTQFSYFPKSTEVNTKSTSGDYFVFYLGDSVSNGPPSSTKHFFARKGDTSKPKSASPDFDFLAPLHNKLWCMTDGTLSKYMTKLIQSNNDFDYTTVNTDAQYNSPNNANKTHMITLQAMFYSAVRPDISNATYIRMVVRQLSLPSYVYVLAFVYLERLDQTQMEAGNAVMKVTQDNMHRLFVTACYVAARVLTPTLGYVTFEHFARAGGLKSGDEVKLLVEAFDELIGHDYHVMKDSFKHMVEEL